MNTSIAQLQDGKWYVVKQMSNPCGINAYVKVSDGYATSYEARAYQLEIIMGRV